MAAEVRVEIREGATWSRTVTVDDTTGKTYAAEIRDRGRCLSVEPTVTVVDGTTVTVSLTPTQTSELPMPCQILRTDRSAWGGWYFLEETTTATGAVDRIEEGRWFGFPKGAP